VQVELARDLSGNEFLLALEWFVSLRRVSKVMVSDNGTNFTFVQPLVGHKVKITDPKVVNHLSSNQVEWYFIPAFSHWYGGAYERIVGIVKSCLHKALSSSGSQLVDFVTLQTVLHRVANIVNNRPLTYVPSDELFKPLTPNYFLKLGNCNVETSLEINTERSSQPLSIFFKVIVRFKGWWKPSVMPSTVITSHT